MEDESIEQPGDGIRIAQRLVTTVAVLAVIGTVIALALVQRMGDRYRDGLEVARDGADVAGLGAASAASLATDISDLVAAATEGLEQTQRIVELASTSVSDIGEAMSTNLPTGVEGTASIADGVADFIEAVERFIPGDRQSLAEELRAVSDGLEPLPGQLRALGDQLEQTSTELDGTVTTLDGLEVQLGQLRTSVATARAAIDRAGVAADDLGARADHALDGASFDLWLARILVVVVGIGVAAACWAARRALGSLGGAGGGSRTHTPLGTGS